MRYPDPRPLLDLKVTTMEFDLSFWIGLAIGAVLVLIALAVIGTATARRGRQALVERDAYNRQLGAERARRDAQNVAAKAEQATHG